MTSGLGDQRPSGIHSEIITSSSIKYKEQEGRLVGRETDEFRRLAGEKIVECAMAGASKSRCCSVEVGQAIRSFCGSAKTHKYCIIEQVLHLCTIVRCVGALLDKETRAC